MGGEGLLAQIVVDKYVDHLPLHRQMQRFNDWVKAVLNHVAALYEAHKKILLACGYLRSKFWMKVKKVLLTRATTGYITTVRTTWCCSITEEDVDGKALMIFKKTTRVICKPMDMLPTMTLIQGKA
ncbi:hypothetical protein EXU57_24250 [Segetibacter sp. 3557_3]|nr:hypothetical protein EXU57_24250 [Segetibacter sp. 3557_3]